MTRTEQERLVEEVLRQVMQAKNVLAEPEGTEPSEQLLVLGPSGLLPREVRQSYRILGAEWYQGQECLEQVSGVYVTQLSRRDLADVALGRDSSTTACAVTSALLRGLPVYLLEQALEYRAFASCASPSLYRVLEGYVRRLQEFGVRMVGSAPASEKSGTKSSAPRLITEADAWELVRSATGPSIAVSAKTLITPSAQDVFRQARRSVVRTES